MPRNGRYRRHFRDFKKKFRVPEVGLPGLGSSFHSTSKSLGWTVQISCRASGAVAVSSHNTEDEPSSLGFLPCPSHLLDQNQTGNFGFCATLLPLVTGLPLALHESLDQMTTKPVRQPSSTVFVLCLSPGNTPVSQASSHIIID